MRQSSHNWEVVVKNSTKVLVDSGASINSHRLESNKFKQNYLSASNTNKLVERLTTNPISLQKSLEARKKLVARGNSKPQKSFTLEHEIENSDSLALKQPKPSLNAHKRTKTLGEKPNFILDKSKPKIETAGSSLMARLSEKLQLDIGKISQDRTFKKVELLKKLPAAEAGHKLTLETNSLAKRISEMKSSTRPLTERSNPNHIGRLTTNEKLGR